MKEAAIVHGSAARMDEGAVRAEIARIERGMQCAQSASATARYETRLAIFRERLRQLRCEKHCASALDIPPSGFIRS